MIDVSPGASVLFTLNKLHARKKIKNLIRIPTGFIPAIKEILLAKLLCVPVERAADPAGVHVATLLGQDGVQGAHNLQAKKSLM